MDPTCQSWTWTAGPLKKVQQSYPTIQGFEDRSKIPSQGDGPCKKVNFHILSQIEFPVDFGPGVLGPLEPKGQNGQTYNAQFRQEP